MKPDDPLQKPVRRTEHSRLTAGDSEPEITSITAAWFAQAGPALDPRPGFIPASRRRIQARVSAHCGRNPWLMRKWSALYWWQSPILHVALVVLLAAAGYFNIARITQSSRNWLPGDWLYPLKPAAESLTLAASFSAEKDAQLHIEYAHRRLMEVQSLALENRFEQISTTVADYDRHVGHAVRIVDAISGEEREQARGLAVALEQTISGQMEMVGLLADLTPGSAQAEFEQLMIISADGVSAARRTLVLGPG